MSRQKILIMGASVRAAAQSAQRAGFDVVASDIFGDEDLRGVATEFIPIVDYPGDFAGVIDRHREVPVMYTGGLENYPALVGRATTLWGNGYESLCRARDPFNWTPLVSGAGLKTAAVRKHDNPPTQLASWLMKPLSGAGGVKVQPAAYPNPGEDWFYQQRVVGAPMSAVFVTSQQDTTFVGATFQLVGLASLNAGQFSYCGSIGPAKLPPATVDALKTMGRAVASGCGLLGLFGIDFVLVDTWPVPIEINPRYTASVEVLEAAGSWQSVGSHASCFGASFNRPCIEGVDGQPTACSVKLVVYTRSPVKAPELPTRPGEAAAWYADIPAVGTLIPAGGPVCSIVGKANEWGTLLIAIRKLLSRVVPWVSIAVDDVIERVSHHSYV